MPIILQIHFFIVILHHKNKIGTREINAEQDKHNIGNRHNCAHCPMCCQHYVAYEFCQATQAPGAAGKGAANKHKAGGRDLPRTPRLILRQHRQTGEGNAHACRHCANTRLRKEKMEDTDRRGAGQQRQANTAYGMRSHIQRLSARTQ